MRVVTCLPALLESRLRTALDLDDTIESVPRGARLSDAVEQQAPDLLVFDPRQITERGERPLTVPCAVPFFVYTSSAPVAIRDALPYARSGARDIVLDGVTDSPEMLRHVIQQVRAERAGAQLLAAIAPALERMPADPARAVALPFRDPLRCRTVEEWAEQSRVPMRTLYRWCSETGLAPPKTLLVAARVAYAYQQLRARSSTIKALTVRMGYEHPRYLTRHVRAVTGVMPRELAQMSQADVLARLVARIRPGPKVCGASA